VANKIANNIANYVANDWHSFTLHGLLPIDPHAPIVHISYFEADAYARWRGAQHGQSWRLPTEAEWEHAAQQHPVDARNFGNFAESEAWHPLPVSRTYPGPMQLLGDVWEWTRSSYEAYPGYQPWAGAVGEYNGKFMVNQYVLRGGSCATPADHLRTSYRNFFPTEARWQFSGLRLARSSG
jgi:formylglycine-generating enzyme required for sulfatase activity